MSALAGILRRDGGPPQASLARLSRSLRRLGPDGEAFAVSGPAGMVYRPFHTFSASRRWQQPLQDLRGRLLTWDGRLDNGADLASELGLSPALREDDPRLVLAAYERWGLGSLSRLIGDFALALWDPAETRLVLARDAFGARPLYYAAEPGSLAWASALGPLLERRGTGLPEIDEEFVADFLTFPNASERTPYEDIRSVPPGCALVAGRIGEELHCFWAFDPGRHILDAGDAEHEERFRELFREAVRVRLRAEGTVCAELSGGLDSSSIVCMADEILRAGEAEAGKLETISYVFDRATRSDERPFIRAVEEWRGRPGIHLREDDHPILTPLSEDARLEYPTFEHAFAARHEQVERTLRDLGARVLLSGDGGDQVTWGSVGLPLEPADLLSKLRLFGFLRSLRTWRRALDIPFVELLWEGTIHPLLPRRVRASSSLVRSGIPAWIDAGFQRRMSLPSRRLGVRARGLPSDQFQALMLHSCAAVCSRGYFLLDGCIEPSYPFLHRPLVEFLLAVPLSQKIRPGENRSLMRRALRGLLPDEVASRNTKSGPSSAIYRGIAREWRWIETLLEAPRVAERGWVDAYLLRRDFERARHGAPVDIVLLVKVLTLELWLRSMERWSTSGSAAWGGGNDEVPVLTGSSRDFGSLERR